MECFQRRFYLREQTIEAEFEESNLPFESLVEQHMVSVRRLAFRIVRDREAANDVTQDVFMRAFRHMDAAFTTRHFERWIIKITRNAAIDELRRRRRKAALELYAPVHEIDPAEAAVSNDERRRLRRALEALPAKYHVALDLHYFKHFEYREIALALDLPVGTVKTHISRGKRFLRAVITPDKTAI